MRDGGGEGVWREGRASGREGSCGRKGEGRVWLVRAGTARWPCRRTTCGRRGGRAARWPYDRVSFLPKKKRMATVILVNIQRKYVNTAKNS